MATSILQKTLLFNSLKNVNDKLENRRKGVENIAEILAVEGVHGCLIGPNDLSADYGCLGNSSASEILSAIKKVGAECRKQGKVGGIITANKNYIQCAEESELEMYSVGSELNAIAKYCKEITKNIKG